MNDDETPVPDPRLVESEQRYQAVIENASDMIQGVRPDGTFEFVNKAWRTTLAYTDDDLARMTIWDIVHPDAVEHCSIFFMRAIRGEPIAFLETVFVARDGRLLAGYAESTVQGFDCGATGIAWDVVLERG